jgi:hypothetical protein
MRYPKLYIRAPPNSTVRQPSARAATRGDQRVGRRPPPDFGIDGLTIVAAPVTMRKILDQGSVKRQSAGWPQPATMPAMPLKPAFSIQSWD